MIEKVNFDKMSGLVPVVVQDADSLQVTMVGFMNREALQETLRTNRVTFWSRTKSKLWQKGETSGHYLEVVSIHLDCDNDALLIKAKTNGPVCHTGNHTCFGEKEQVVNFWSILENLEKTLEQRKNADPADSYTAKLYSEGLARITQKVGEEAIETIIAALEQNDQRFIEETADLLYHLLVLLHFQEKSLKHVTEELKRRMK